jgi:hypothetical protein
LEEGSHVVMIQMIGARIWHESTDKWDILNEFVDIEWDFPHQENTKFLSCVSLDIWSQDFDSYNFTKTFNLEKDKYTEKILQKFNL